MSQLKYDIAEFIINNRDEIKDHITDQLSMHYDYSSLFQEYPEMYEEILKERFRNLLLSFLVSELNLDYESLILILDDEFVKITLDY
jgi:hypothetical protein